MNISITINGENAAEVLSQLRQLSAGMSSVSSPVGEALALSSTVNAGSALHSAKPEPEPEKKPAKEKKAKEEKVAEPKAEVLAPEKPKYTLQDAINRAREIAGNGEDEKIMIALKGVNTRLGISKVREIPPEKLDGYMKELNAEFPKAAETTGTMFD